MNNEVIEAMKTLQEAYLNMLSVWEDHPEINELKAITKYPFDKSFDELGLSEFLEEAIGELAERGATCV